MSKLAHSSHFMDEIEDDDDYASEPDCCHEDYEVDPLTGRASCQMCGETWWLSEAEHLHHIDMQSAWERNWEEHLREVNSPWNRFKEWCRRKWPNGWRYQPIVPDDEIPF